MNLFEPAVVRLDGLQSLQHAESVGPGDIYQALGDQTIYHRDMLRGGGVLTGELDVVSSERFAEPDNIDKLRAAISEHSLLVIIGHEGVGKRASALRVLYEWTNDPRGVDVKPAALTELFVDWEKPSVGDLPCQPRTAYLLDLGGEVYALPDRFGRELASHAEKLRRVDSCLVMTVTIKAWELCSRLALPFEVSHVAPSAVEVLQNHLKALTSDPRRLAWGEHESILAALSAVNEPEAAASLAEKMASQTVQDIADVQGHLEEFMRWPGYLKNEFRQSRDVPHRALLLTLAVVGEQTSGIITAAQQELLTALGAHSKAEISIGQPDIEGRLAELKVDLVDGVAFLDRGKPGLGRTVLKHVWINYWDVHDNLIDWIVCLATAEQAAQVVPQIAKAVVDLAVDVKDPSLIDSVAKRAELDQGCRDLATKILQLAVDVPELGQFAREMLLRWSKGKSKGNQLSVLAVCRGGFAISYPGYALTRLRWMLLSEDAMVSENAAETLRWVAMNVQPRDFVLRTVANWLGQTAGVLRAGKRGALALLTPASEYVAFLDALVQSAHPDTPLEGDLKAGWRALLADGELRGRATHLVEQWLAAIASGELEASSSHAFLFEVLREAALEDLSILESLIDPAHAGSDWSAGIHFRQLRRQVLRAVFGRRNVQAVPFQPAIAPL